VKDQIFFLA